MATSILIMDALSCSLTGCFGAARMPGTNALDKAWLGSRYVQGPQPRLPPHLAALGFWVAGSILLCASLHIVMPVSAWRSNWATGSWMMISTGCMLI